MKIPSNLQIRQELARLNRIDIRRLDYDHLKRTFHQITAGMATVVTPISSGERYFRARIKSESRIERVDEILAPPKELVAGYQRCNPPHSPIFYSSSKRATAISEIGARPGDTVYLSEWISKKRMPTNMTLDINQTGKFELNNNSVMLHSYFDTIFTKRIHKDFSNEYKFTSAISEILTKGFKKNEELQIEEDGFIALRYPSVVDIEGSYNTAIPPIFCENRLELIHVCQLFVTKLGDNSMHVRILNNALEFPDGSIDWLNDHRRIPAPRRKDGILFINTGRRTWHVETTSEEHSPALLHRFLYE